MSSDLSGLGRHAFFLRWLKVSLVAGAVYDLFFAAVILLWPTLPERLLGLRPPGDPHYLWLIAVFLTMLAGFYFYAAYDPRAYAGNIRVAIVGRFLGFVALLAGALHDPTLSGLYPLAFADLAFAAAHAALWWPIRR